MENYRLYCTLNFKNGETFDVSSLVREVTIVHSLTFAVPIVEIKFNRLSSIDFTTVATTNLEIHFYNHSGDVKHIDKLTLVNAGFPEHTVNVPTGDSTTIFSNQGSAILEPLTFYYKSVYEAVHSTVGPVLKFNTTAKEVIDSILPSNCVLSKHSLMDESIPIDQIYIPKMSFLKALNYLDYWFSLNATSIYSILPIPNEADKCQLILENINKAFRDGNFDKIIYFRQGKKIPLVELAAEPTGKVFVSDYPFKVQHRIIPKRDFCIITKPDKKLYSKLELNEMEILKNFSAAYKSY